MIAIKKRLVVLDDRREGFCLIKVFESLFNTQCLASAGLAINAAAAVTWKTTNATPLPYTLNGRLFLQAALTAQAIPAGAALPATTNQAVMVMVGLDATGALVTSTSAVFASVTSSAVAVSNLTPPPFPDTAVCIGAIVIASVATAFVPGTTALDAAGITVTYINTVGPFFPIAPV